MGINHFTKEQQEQLRRNPYIKNVSDKAITYTTEFRELFAKEYRCGYYNWLHSYDKRSICERLPSQRRLAMIIFFSILFILYALVFSLNGIFYSPAFRYRIIICQV